MTTQHAQGTYRCTLVPVLAFGMTVRSIGALATDVDSGRMTMGNQAPGVSMQFHAGLNCFMLRQQRAAWASLQGHILKPELMTNAQGQNQAVCVTMLLAQRSSLV